MATLYALGTIIGAGIYALIGQVTAKAGLYAPFAFALAGVMASMTVRSYAELAALYPSSVGESLYLQRAFGHRYISITVGLLVIVAGCVSAATVTSAFSGYFQHLVQWPRHWVVFGLLAALRIVQGSLLAYFAFIGFESIITMGDEVGEPVSVLPKAIVWATTGATGLYTMAFSCRSCQAGGWFAAWLAKAGYRRSSRC
jgi:basic amino acid/polyamine antiporter, APA family